MIQSPFDILWQPAGAEETVALAEVLGWLQAPPSFEATQELFESDGINLGSGFFRPLGNVEVSINFAVEEEAANLAALLGAFLTAEAAGEVNLLQGSGPLRFAPDGVGSETIFPDAVVTSISSELPADPGATGLPARVREFSIRTTLPE